MATFRFPCAQCDEWHAGEPSVLHNGMFAERAQALFEKVLHQDGAAH